MYKAFKLVFAALLISVGLKAQITVTGDSTSIGVYDVLELSINHPQTYANNWEDVKVNAVFTGPRQITIHGFFYDTNTWKIRFAPPETGSWTYTINFTTPAGTFTSTGAFNCVASETKGFLHRHPNNVYRLIYADGTLFNGVGFEDCVSDFNGNGTPLDDFGFDGNLRTGGYTGSFANLKNYMNAYGANGAGFNLYRWTTDNCSFRLYNNISTDGNSYLTKEGMFGDTLVRELRKNKIRIWLTFFGPPVFNNIDGSNPQEEAAIKRYIDYVIARYGAYVDIWELFNESSASQYYINSITSYIRSIDPYHRLISISDERPKDNAIDIVSPHWYQKEPELQSDAVAASMIDTRKIYKKPIIFGEQGNAIQNWDPLSALRMRLRLWTSFFSEGMLIFWNTSFAKDYQHPKSANIYLGPEERGYVRALQDYSALADSSFTPVKIIPANPLVVRAYGLGSAKTITGYFHHYTSHDDKINTSFKIRLHRYATIYWINPSDNTVISSTGLSYGTQTITSPPFDIDMAMRIVLANEDPVFDENQKLDLIVYPNPAVTSFAVDGNFNQPARVELFDVSGKKVLSEINIKNDEFINIQHLPPGTYIYSVTTNKRHATGKLIKK